MNKDIISVRRIVLHCLSLAIVVVPALAFSGMQSLNSGVNQSALNSEAIQEKFGSYGVEVIRQDENVRISSLYSESGGTRTTRTLAVVLFSADALEVVEDEHEDILDGSSIGSTFRDAGWQVNKANLYLGEIRGTGGSTLVDSWLGDSSDEIFAIHIYDFFVSKGGRSYKYATIAEIHDPDYLTLADLQSRYSEEASQLQRINSWNADALRDVFMELDR